MPVVLGTLPLGYFTPLIWGAMGWASQAPQQHTLLQLRPDQGRVAVALNSSANYLGGAAGAGLGGVVVTDAGISAVPTAAAAVAAAGLALQVAILARRGGLTISAPDKHGKGGAPSAGAPPCFGTGRSVQ